MASVHEEQESVLAEVAHDLANRFHRYYYYSDLAVETLADVPAEVRELLAKAMETVEGIEVLTRTTLSFLRRMELRTILVRADDVVGSLRQHLGEHALESRSCAPSGTAMIAIDPPRFGEVLATCCRILLERAVPGAPLRLELTGDGCLELRLSVDASSSIPATPDLALALATKILALHGGELLIPATSQAGIAALTVRLPLAAQE
ncbi:MAG: hypothetical protein HY899_18930 [Deltaproteobacteria bacterium]|nr:hypothetical protein [Deltaproteobacteria bacterium]